MWLIVQYSWICRFYINISNSQKKFHYLLFFLKCCEYLSMMSNSLGINQLKLNILHPALTDMCGIQSKGGRKKNISLLHIIEKVWKGFIFDLHHNIRYCFDIYRRQIWITSILWRWCHLRQYIYGKSIIFHLFNISPSQTFLESLVTKNINFRWWKFSLWLL